MKFRDVLSLSFKTVRSNKLRSGITVAIIAFGIMALIGIITAITAMNQSLYENFSILGANTFTIRFKERNIHFGGNGSDLKKTRKGVKEKSSNLGKPITYDQAREFKERYTYPAFVSISRMGLFNATVTHETAKTNPNVRVLGADENYLQNSGYTIDAGRNFNSIDTRSGRNVALVGSDIVKKLFQGKNNLALNNFVRVSGNPYRIIGILNPKGASNFLALDNIVITTNNNVRRLYSGSGSSTYNITINVKDYQMMEPAIGEAKGIFRTVRKLAIKEADNFTFEKSDSLVEMFKSALSIITKAATAIGLITLIGAAIGLTNIMLVAVNERTREIGLVKSLGSTRSTVRNQFLWESIIISLLGAGFGILLGVIVGNSFAIVLKTGFVVPWDWVLVGMIVCFFTGLLAGLFPAIKAARLDPIVALRYE